MRDKLQEFKAREIQLNNLINQKVKKIKLMQEQAAAEVNKETESSSDDNSEGFPI